LFFINQEAVDDNRMGDLNLNFNKIRDC